MKLLPYRGGAESYTGTCRLGSRATSESHSRLFGSDIASCSKGASRVRRYCSKADGRGRSYLRLDMNRHFKEGM